MTCSGHLTERDRRNQLVVTGWIFLWSVGFVVASYLLKRELVEGTLKWAVAILPTVIGLGTILVFRRFLAQADELQRKIQLDALALGFGVGVIGSVGLELLQAAGAPAFDPSSVMVLMIVAYSVAAYAGMRRY